MNGSFCMELIFSVFGQFCRCTFETCFLIFYYVYVCMYAFVPHACLVLKEDRKECQRPWNQSST